MVSVENEGRKRWRSSTTESPRICSKFIEAQHIFFVASAPLSAEGHVNLSPKGRDSLRVLSDHRVAYLDLIGSGNETSAHLLENGSITFMFCAFDGAPNIVRLFGKGRTVLPSDPEWAELRPLVPDGYINVRQIIVADIDKTRPRAATAFPSWSTSASATRWSAGRKPKARTG